ncbi:MAG TPA: hypothetical protein PLZ61_03510 [Candidatus Cryosericum sp.]|jgi:hypothetical protein|nr:hypothetical protein [Candidatus Cryosericum sp.]
MHERVFVTATALLLVLIVGVSGCILVGCSESASEEKTTVITALVDKRYHGCVRWKRMGARPTLRP